MIRLTEHFGADVGAVENLRAVEAVVRGLENDGLNVVRTDGSNFVHGQA
jgi:hypothetical protein